MLGEFPIRIILTERKDVYKRQVLVLLKGEHQRVLKTTLAMADVAYDLLLEIGINISPLPVWLDQWEHPESFSNPALLHNIAREGVRL